MLRARVIPVLLLADGGALVKSIRFGERTYIGDPLNAVRILNDKEVDELIVADIDATPGRRPPDFALIEQIAGECFMPLAYGGGVRSVDDVRRLVGLGVEKVALGAAAVERPDLVGEAAALVGSSSVVVAIDVRRDLLGRDRVAIGGGRRRTSHQPAELAARLEALGAGEVLLTSIERDGSRRGYDLELIREVAAAVRIPVIAAGGAGERAHLEAALRAGAAAVAAGSLFVLQGKHRAVLISYLAPAEIDELTRTLAGDARASAS